MANTTKWLNNVDAIIDGQWGSTGKGAIASRLASEYDFHVRVGAPNAGHTHYFKGQKWVNQSIPVGWTNFGAMLIIGRGALINMDILVSEITAIESVDWGIKTRIAIDANAGIISPWHVEEEGHTDGDIHKRIGSTGEGVGAARRDRINRDPKKFKRFKDVAAAYNLEELICNSTQELLWNASAGKNQILLEGAQGSGLDLIHGDWPYVTSNGCGVAQMAADVGVPPTAIRDTTLVLRTHPIRVAGSSGPLPNETTWEAISSKLGREVSERTTVTKKVRRVAEWSWDIVDQAVRLNNPTGLAVNFADYWDPENEGATKWGDLSSDFQQFIIQLENRYEIPVDFIGTGGLGEPRLIDFRKNK